MNMKLIIISLAFVISASAHEAVEYEVMNDETGMLKDVGTSVTIGCSYIMHGATNDSRPYVYWYKGRTIDDENAVQIFYGYEGYEENDDVKLFYNGYESNNKASVDDIRIPSLTLNNLETSDEGRYWCMVTDFTQSSQLAMDADSTALSITTQKAYNTVELGRHTEVNVGNPATLDCDVVEGEYDMITWLEGPFYDGAQAHSEYTGQYYKIGSYNYYGSNPGENIEPEYQGKMEISSTGSLTVISTDAESDGRYWCRGMNMMGTNMELETDQSSTLLEVEGGSFDCTGLEDGMYPSEYECSVFWQCVDGEEYLFECYPGLVFNPETNTCDYPANVCGDCSTNPEAEPCEV